MTLYILNSKLWRYFYIRESFFSTFEFLLSSCKLATFLFKKNRSIQTFLFQIIYVENFNDCLWIGITVNNDGRRFLSSSVCLVYFHHSEFIACDFPRSIKAFIHDIIINSFNLLKLEEMKLYSTKLGILLEIFLFNESLFSF